MQTKQGSAHLVLLHEVLDSGQGAAQVSGLGDGLPVLYPGQLVLHVSEELVHVQRLFQVVPPDVTGLGQRVVPVSDTHTTQT